jgi:hypothetical protein
VRAANRAAVPFILPFKTAILSQTDGKTSGGAVFRIRRHRKIPDVTIQCKFSA